MTVELSTITRIALEIWADIGRRTSLPTKGFSMWPILRSGEWVSVRHGGAWPEIGQIVVVLDGDRTVAHRVVKRRESGGQIALQTKGDTCLTADRDWVAADRIVGVIEGVVEGEVVIERLGIAGRSGHFVAVLSRAQGILCAPLGFVVDRVTGKGRRRGPPGVEQ